MAEEIPSDDNIDDIIDALKEKNQQLNKEVRKVSKENIEEFVVDSAGAVINECVDLVKNLGVYLHAAADPKDLSAFSELINASANAIETLNKIIVQNKKTQLLKDLKKMDYEIKKDLLGEAKDMLVLSREDMFKKLKNVEIIEIKQPEVLDADDGRNDSGHSGNTTGIEAADTTTGESSLSGTTN